METFEIFGSIGATFSVLILLALCRQIYTNYIRKSPYGLSTLFYSMLFGAYMSWCTYVWIKPDYFIRIVQTTGGSPIFHSSSSNLQLQK